jgi:HPt (histidine-containing phosphotransfer) domain-containing protein
LELNIDNNKYIDVEDALRRIGGNMDMYKRLLKHFAERNNIETCETTLARGDMEESARLIHTLKGVCANLSLIGISTILIDLEETIKDGLDFSGQLIKLKLAFNTTLALISEMTK